MYRSILVPLDGSTFGEHALPLAWEIARRTGASLKLLHVIPPFPVIDAGGPLLADADLTAHFQGQARAYLEGLLQRLGGVADVAVTPTVLEGEVVSQVKDFAARAEVDLVVMATHGRGPLARFWLGSVADELVRQLPLPLLLVRPREKPPDPRGGPDLGRVLLPLDGSPLAERALEPAVALGGAGATYTLLRVVKPALLPAYAPEGRSLEREAKGLLDQIEALQQRLLAEAEEYLAGVAGRLRAQGLQVQTRVAVEEQPAVAILREAADARAGLIALGTHGRRGLARLFLGSVADKVVRGAAVPVLVHRCLKTGTPGSRKGATPASR
ncbi:MAG TPA: universal stress protein [Gemmataceae bacterium]|nr:universal stress protein [Gemmataceae bacterium]